MLCMTETHAAFQTDTSRLYHVETLNYANSGVVLPKQKLLHRCSQDFAHLSLRNDTGLLTNDQINEFKAMMLCKRYMQWSPD